MKPRKKYLSMDFFVFEISKLSITPESTWSPNLYICTGDSAQSGTIFYIQFDTNDNIRSINDPFNLRTSGIYTAPVNKNIAITYRSHISFNFNYKIYGVSV